MRLSILIPSIPSRFGSAITLYNSILRMCEGKDIEVLMLVDNKQRTIGEKREALKNISKGKYFMFCDDDDSLLSVNEIYKATKKNVDVITFKQRCYNTDGSEFIVTFGLGNEMEHNSNGKDGYADCRRPPFHVCAWHKKFIFFHYPDISYGEDAVWIEKALKHAKTEHHIDKVIHSYNFNPTVTEASVKSNKYWKNPADLPEAKRCIVNLATERYWEGATRLLSSISDPVIFSRNESDVGAPRHSENPYAFKIYAIERARSEGYNQILWLDASVYAVKNIDPVFDWLTDKGIFMEEAGHYVGSWCNDYTLSYFGITREEAMKMPMFAAGYIGFDFRQPVSVEFFAEWKESMLNGCFKGSWENHRHDMTCGSIIANKRGLLPLYSPGGQFFAYVGEAFGKPKDSAVFHLQGI